MSANLGVEVVATSPIDGQKTGTSGLRKKVKVFQEKNYLNNWLQSLFNALGAELNDSTLVIGGDGRYFNKEALDIAIRMAAANGVKRVIAGQNGILSTPAVSALIRDRAAFGGIIMTASHNPAGPNADWGIKYNSSNGGPAPEGLTNKIFEETKNIKDYKIAKGMPTVDLSKAGVSNFDGFSVEVVDSVGDYLKLMKEVFDFTKIKAFVNRPNFKMLYDALNGVTGVYAHEIFAKELGIDIKCLTKCIPLDDFGGLHADPNLTYAKDLADAVMKGSEYDFGAASDGDGDRNMIVARDFFVTPSDSVAVIAANSKCIPYYSKGLKGVARSMPTGGALERVAKALDVEFFEVPTGWKFFGNLMDAGRLSICGEESFGTGSDHVREKDGIWAVLAWLSILANENENVPEGQPLVSVKDIVTRHWNKFGRNFFTRYDYEECESDKAGAMMEHLQKLIDSGELIGKAEDGYKFSTTDSFTYTDPIDNSVARNQGLRFLFEDGSRFVFRLSGTGSAGATIRLYIEKYVQPGASNILNAPESELKSLIDLALKTSKLEEFTGRKEPTVIT